MAETSQLPDSSPSAEHNIIGPDYFGFYTCALVEFLSQVEDHLPFLPQNSNFEEKDCLAKNGHTLTENYGIAGSASLFSNAIGDHLSDFKKERLRSLLRQSLLTFTQEVDAILTPVLQICRVQSLLRYKKSTLSVPGGPSESDRGHHPHKKQKIDDDLLFLLDNDPTKLEEMTKKESDEFFNMIRHMEQKLEEFLGILMSNCRPMTLAEKQQLRKLIKDLPRGNLDRVVEIIQHNKPIDRRSSDEIYVDLEKEDNVTLWRLYYYVESVENARKLYET